jgi:hypothetical protein
MTPPIVTNGLVLHLDAANSKSYVSGSTIWNDLSGNGYNGTLTNGPTFDSANGGNIVFDGIDDYVAFNNTSTILNGLSAASMNMWINVTRKGGGGYQTIAGWRDDTDTDFFLLLLDSAGVTVNTEFRTRTSSGAVSDVNINYTSYFGSWNFISTVVSSNRTDLYINGILVGSNTSKTGVFGAASNQFRIGSNPNLDPINTYQMQGRMANFLAYNRALTATEITQNYNAQKSRFNLI